jgi:nudix-type nucleoside diphosphatase (YffH/AdpP family)
MKDKTPMPKKVEILEIKTLFQKYIFRVIEARLRHERFDGSMSPEFSRINFERGDAVAALMYNPIDDTIVLQEDFRYPSYEKTQDGWLIEIPAGVIEEGEKPADTMRREIMEETGYAVDSLKEIFNFFLSPGGSSERIYLFFCRIDPSQKVGKGGGLEHENEDIRSFHLKVDDALKMLEEQKIMDAKSIIALQWLGMNRARLKTI